MLYAYFGCAIGEIDTKAFYALLIFLQKYLCSKFWGEIDTNAICA
jgi:hypothetical protein